MTTTKLLTTVAFVTCSLVTAGCNDPSKGKSKATAGEAVTVTSQQASASVLSSAKYTFDASTSKIRWTGSKVTGKHEGGFGTFTGSVDVGDSSPEKSKVTVDIDTTSITSDDPKLTKHLSSADFFDVAKFPKATFVSTSIARGGDKGASHTVTGNLTIKGISKSIRFPATIVIAGDTANLDAEFTINRRDFQLNYAGMPNDLIRDDVVLALSIKSKKLQ